MTAVATPAPVYWLLNAIQLVGVLGIVGGLWFLATKAAGPIETYRIRRQMKKPAKTVAVTLTADTTKFLLAMRQFGDSVGKVGDDLRRRRSERGAGRIETFVAWILIVGGCAAAWAFVIYGLAAVS